MADLLPISALQHLLFCERQCALIHIEQVWAENQFTAEGKVLHERAHGGGDEGRPGVRITRALPVVSVSLGLSGECDVVEFHRDPPPAGAVVPVEYKRGKPKDHRADEVQLCAQALCLEEMLGRPVPTGAIYYGERRRRTDVPFDGTLRALTRDTAARLHRLISSGLTPPGVKEKKCESCSLATHCMPALFSTPRNVSNWFIQQLHFPA